MQLFETIYSVSSEIKAVRLRDQLGYYELRVFNQCCTLPVSDITSMAVSLEGRVPFLHNEVVDFAFSIPFDLKVRGLKTKYIFRKAMEPILPKEIVRMKKKGFSVPGSRWIKNELKPYVTDMLSGENLSKIPFLNSNAVGAVLDNHLSGKVDNTRNITCLVARVEWYNCFN